MCGRFAFHSPHATVAQLFALVESTPPFAPSWNLAPTQPVPVVRAGSDGERALVPLRWGLVPAWAKDPAIGQRLINARAETLADKPAFRSAFRRRRCLVLADGWYEWRAEAHGKQPYFVHAASGEPFGMAGLWESWRAPDGGAALESCVIVTRPASAAIREIHERMPALIATAGHAAWLAPGGEPAELAALLAGDHGFALAAHPVSRRVNHPGNNGPELVAPVAGEIA